jgi:hypothetical protein
VAAGLNTGLHIKKETAYGTEATGTYNTVPFTSETLQLQYNRLTSSNIDTNPAVDSIFTTGKFVTGDITMIPTYENLEWAFRGVLGASTGTPATDAGAFDNVYDPALSLESWTVKVDRDDVASNGVYTYLGMKVSSVSLSWSSSGEPSATVSLVGQDEDSTVVTGDTAPVTPQVLYGGIVAPTQATVYHTGESADSGTTYCLTAFDININRNLAADRFCIGSGTTIQEPEVSTKMEVSGSMTIEVLDRLHYDEFRLQTELTGMRFTFVGDTIVAVDNYGMDFDINKIRYDSPSVAQVDGPGPLSLTVNWTAYGNAATEPLQILTTNTLDSDAEL